MNKWFGVIGFAEEATETKPSVYEEPIIEKQYYGEVKKNNRRYMLSDTVNGEITVSNQLSVISDPYIQNHFYSIRYATFCGVKWTVTNVDVEWPRLVLTLGGVWNGPSGS